MATMAFERPSSKKMEAQSFIHFTHLPVEIQLNIWELAGDLPSFLWAAWPDSGLTMMAPLAQIPELGESDLPGLIPYILPNGMPHTLERFPLPFGYLRGRRGISFRTYRQMMMGEDWGDSVLTRFTGAIRKSLNTAIGVHERPQNTLEYRPILEHIKTCMLSRKAAFRRAIVRANQVLPADATPASSRPTFYSLHHGALSADIFYNEKTGRKCFLFALGVDNTTTKMAKSMLRTVPDSSEYSFTAAWLADIEHCIFGHRLSFTVIPKNLDNQRFEQLGWAMWWMPFSDRARRPEANHPFFLPPESIIATYSSILHRLVDDHSNQKNPCPEAVGWTDIMYTSGTWYFHVVQTGKCIRCGKLLMKDLQQNFPDLMDKDGYIDILALLQKSAFEIPQKTMGTRDHEVFFY